MDVIKNILSTIFIGKMEIASVPKTFGFNSDILEANLINIIILASGVIYLIKNFLTSALSNRQKRISTIIREAEEKLTEATRRLSESEQQLNQSKTIIDRMKEDAQTTADKIYKNITDQNKLDVDKANNNTSGRITKLRLQANKQLQKEITNVIIEKASSRLKEVMNPQMQSKIIDLDIYNLQDKI